jgi:dolichyl-phosphate-mannose-protein mannosyltransferase
MGRQLFLHHYLPAHLASALVTGALVEFVFNVEPIDLPAIESSQASSSSKKKEKDKSSSATQPERKGGKQRLDNQSLLATWAAAGVVMICVIGGWWYFLPLTYGKPGLSVEEVVARKWLGYDLHFAK